ncbi:MAG: hypothetical protein JNL74_09620 [Fibrobacteres bacterium]|nr:hypothetical protein [Fibrobacterota bacterium]
MLAFISSAESADYSLNFVYSWVVGPTFYWNFGATKDKPVPERHFALGFQVSYYRFVTNESVPVGINLGIEYDFHENTRLYSELQSGYYYGGLALGAVAEIKEQKTKFGFQSSLWLGALLFGSARYRKFQDESYWAPGFTLSVPVYIKE